MSLWINNKRLVPAPLVTINKQAIFTDDDRLINTQYNINLRGTLLPNLGSPRVSGWHTSETDVPNDTSIVTVDQSHDAILRKQEYLRELFANTGLYFYYAPSGISAVECYAKLNAISFDPGTWVNRADYNIDLSANYMNKVGTSGVEDNWYLNSSGYGLTRVSDALSISQREDSLSAYTVSRTVSATAKTLFYASGIFGGEAWLNAKAWVLNRLSTVGIESNYFNLPTGVAASGYTNKIDEESVDKTAGTYTISQRYSYNLQNYIETRRVSRNTVRPLFGDLSPTVETINVQGTIQGLSSGVDASGRLANAYAYWNVLNPALRGMVGAYGSGQIINLDEDWSNGSLSYSVQFVNNTGSFYRHTFDVSFNYENNLPAVTIAGQIEGITLDGFFGPTGEKFNAAITGWQAIRDNLKSIAFAYGNNIVFGSGLDAVNFSNNPTQKVISYNKPQGLINYSQTYNYTEGTSSDLYTDTFTIDINTANAVETNAGYLVNATINGVVQGLQNSDNPSGRFNNANAGWSTVLGQLYTRTSGYVATYAPNTPGIKNRPVSRTLGFNRPAGQISYAFTYNNLLQASGTNVAQTDINVEEVWPQDVVATQIIPGRSVGPIIQNLGTKTEYRRNININIIMAPNGANHYTFADRTTPRGVARDHLSILTADLGVYSTGYWIVGQSEQWDWRNGVFNANYTVIAPTGA